MDNTTCKHYHNVYFENDTVFNNAGRGLADFLKGVGYLFYIVHPNDTKYENFRDVPNYYTNVSLYLVCRTKYLNLVTV